MLEHSHYYFLLYLYKLYIYKIIFLNFTGIFPVIHVGIMRPWRVQVFFTATFIQKTFYFRPSSEETGCKKGVNFKIFVSVQRARIKKRRAPIDFWWNYLYGSRFLRHFATVYLKRANCIRVFYPTIITVQSASLNIYSPWPQNVTLQIITFFFLFSIIIVQKFFFEKSVTIWGYGL